MCCYFVASAFVLVDAVVEEAAVAAGSAVDVVADVDEEPEALLRFEFAERESVL